jgi:uncharacterized protein
MVTPEQIIEHFGLQPLPVEGGMFSQTYCASEGFPAEHLPPRYTDNKPFGVAIVYLLTADANSFSAMHLLPTDEIYHFYLGDPVEQLLCYPDGRSEHIILGKDILNDQYVQHVAQRNVWQGSRLIPGGNFALLGTTMAPGFTEGDYLGGDRDELIENYPHEADMIRLLTRPEETRRRMTAAT